jgi:hypothetical protein
MDLTFQQFESQLRALGFDTVVEQKCGSPTVADMHSHPLVARALVVKGEMWLTENMICRRAESKMECSWTDALPL